VKAAASDAEWAAAAELIAEYTDATAEEIGVEVAAISQGFAILRAEVARVRETYPAPGGVLVAYAEDEPIGCVALEALPGGVFELRRLYVRPGHRGGLGRALMLAAAEHARRHGGTEIRLDVLHTRTHAIGLYQTLGYLEAAHQTEPNLMVTLCLSL
jgi:ribosomal protein S18 acetylase RimI-like enzyme